MSPRARCYTAASQFEQMAIDNPFLSPSKKLDLEMQQLQDGSLEIEKARAQAEVTFLQEERQGHWGDQSLEAGDWAADAPRALPCYWEAGVQFAATWALGYVQAAAMVEKGPRHFEKVADHCISVLAEWTFRNKLARYAGLKQPQLAWALIHFSRDVRESLEKPLRDWKLKIWQRHKGALATACEPEVTAGTSTESAPVSDSSAPPVPEVIATRWEDLAIRFTSDHRVQITIGKRSELRTYEEMGFRDGRTGNPNSAWHILRKLAENGGMLRDGTTAGAKWSSVEKRIQAIRKTLRGHYGFAGDPLPFVNGTGYRARFMISCSRAY